MRAGSELKVSDEKVHQYSEFGDYRISADCMKVEVKDEGGMVIASISNSGNIVIDYLKEWIIKY